MALTARFGLTHFDAATDGSLSGDGGKFSGRDRRVIDRIFAALEEHTHGGGVRLDDPEFEPTLTLFPTGGTLAGGRTFYYRVSWLDQYALETAAGPEVSIATPVPIQPPAPPRAEAQLGGSLEPGLYWYALSVEDVQGVESGISVPQVLSITDWNQVELSAPNGLPEGTVSVSVWRQGPFDSGFTRIGTFPVVDPNLAMVPIMIDDGSVPSNPTLTPSQSFGSGSNSIQVEVPALPEGARRWRVYRSEASGAYPDFSLIAEVHQTEQEEEGGPVVTTFLDVGDDPGVGKPLESSQTLTPSRPLNATQEGGTVVGEGSATADGAIAIGDLSVASGVQSIAIGTGVETLLDYVARLGDQRHVVRVGGLAPRVLEATGDVDAWTLPDVGVESERASVVLVDATLGPVTVNVATLSTVPGAQVTVKKIDDSANTVTLDPGLLTIDGAASRVLSAQYDKVTLSYAPVADAFFEV